MASASIRKNLRNVSETQAVATLLGGLLQAGDVVVLTGPLGAGKTTFTQGLAHGLGVEEAVTSPTYAIAQNYSSAQRDLAVIHVDAYRLSGRDDLESIDLEPHIESSVTVIEWGRSVVDHLVDSWVDVELDRSNEDENQRTLMVSAVGERGSERLEQFAAAIASSAQHSN